MTTIVAAAVLHNIARRNADPMPPCDPDLNMPEWDNPEYNNVPAPILQDPPAQNSFVRNNIINNYFNR